MFIPPRPKGGGLWQSTDLPMQDYRVRLGNKNRVAMFLLGTRTKMSTFSQVHGQNLHPESPYKTQCVTASIILHVRITQRWDEAYSCSRYKTPPERWAWLGRSRVLACPSLLSPGPGLLPWLGIQSVSIPRSVFPGTERYSRTRRSRERRAPLGFPLAVTILSPGCVCDLASIWGLFWVCPQLVLWPSTGIAIAQLVLESLARPGLLSASFFSLPR